LSLSILRINKFRFPLLLLILIFGFFAFVYFYLIKPQGPFSWDEAHHALFSGLIADSLGTANWRAFLLYTNGQLYWPFFHSWVSAPFLILGGFSYPAARIASLGLGVLSIVFIYAVGMKLPSRDNRRLALIAAALLVLSPMFLIYSATAMIENLGLALTLAIIWSQFKAWDNAKAGSYFLSGLLLAFLFLSKYIYAIFFGLASITFWISLFLFPAQRTERKIVFKNIEYFFMGFLIPWTVWMIIPPTAAKFHIILGRIRDTGGWNYLKLSGIDNRLFYLRALLYAYTFSIGTYILYLAGLAYGLVRMKNIRLRFLLFLFLANLIPMSLIVNTQERFIYSTIPALYLLTASFIDWLWCRVAGKLRLAVSIAVAVVILGDLPKMPVYVRQLANAISGAYAFKIRNEFNYSTFFGFASYPAFLKFPKNFFNPKAPAVRPRHNAEDVLDFVWENTDSEATVCVPFYIGSLSPHLWKWHCALNNRTVVTDWDPDADYFVSLKVDEGSPYRTLRNQHLIEGRTRDWDLFLRDLEGRAMVKLEKEIYFPDIGLGVAIYVKNIPLDEPVWSSITFPEIRNN